VVFSCVSLQRTIRVYLGHERTFSEPAASLQLLQVCSYFTAFLQLQALQVGLCGSAQARAVRVASAARLLQAGDSKDGSRLMQSS
jgi:hypothetical protein